MVLDRIVGLVLLAALLLECLAAFFVGTMLVMVSDPCSPDSCDTGTIDAGVVLGSYGQVIPVLAGVGWLMVRWSQGKLVWFVPLAMAPLPVLLVLVGESIAQSGVH